MEKPTIVKLTDTPNIRVATFEEAFGDHSELRGKGRARRAAKKTAKQAKKQQRIEARLKRKATRKVGRQEIKGAKQAAKQVRKTANTAARIERRAMRRPDELSPEELLDENSIAASDSPESSYSEPATKNDESVGDGEGTAVSDDNAAEPAYHDTNDEESEEENDEEYAEDEESDDDSEEDESGADGNPEDVSWNEDNDGSGGRDFNGGSQFEYDNADGSDFQKEAIDKEANVGEILNRINANQVLIQRIAERMSAIKSSMNQRLPDSQRRKLIEDLKKFKTSLDLRNNRAAELQMQLEAFSNASGKRATKQAAKQAAKTTRVAAKQERKAIKQAGKTAKVAAKVERKAVKQEAKSAKRSIPKPGVTEVEQGLNADIEENRIEVPADEMSSANGIEMYAMQDKNEEFVPEDRIVEIKYGADGIGSSISRVVRPSLILWGAGLYLAYLANKKYQFIKF